MRTIAILLLAATPAAAHDGVHLHPHGIDAGWMLLAATAVAAGAAYVGFVFFPRSPRNLSLESAAALAATVPPACSSCPTHSGTRGSTTMRSSSTGAKLRSCC